MRKFGALAKAVGCLVLFVTIGCTPFAAAIGATSPEVSDVDLVVLFDRQAASSPTPDEIVAAVNGQSGDLPLVAALGFPVRAWWPMQGLTSPIVQWALTKEPKSPRARLEWYVILRYPSAEAAMSANAVVARDPRVLTVERVPLSRFAATPPNDTYFSVNSSYPWPGNYQWGMQLMRAADAWDYVKGTATIAVIDNGVYCASISGTTCTPHADLVANYRDQFSWNLNSTGCGSYSCQVPDEMIGAVISAAGHGTHVAGIVGATPRNSTGVAGACFSCNLAIVKFSNTSGASAPASTPYYDAITLAVDEGVQVLNFSTAIGSYDSTKACSHAANSSWQPLCDAVAYAMGRDVTFVASAGNHYSTGLYFPAIHTDTIAVGGLKSGGYFWDNGNPSTGGCDPSTHAGDECGSNWGPQQDIETLATGSAIVVAPAMMVVSTFYTGKTWNSSIYCGDTYGQNASTANPSSGGGGIAAGYGDCSGTSMAAPHVSGIAGLVRSANPTMYRNLSGRPRFGFRDSQKSLFGPK